MQICIHIENITKKICITIDIAGHFGLIYIFIYLIRFQMLTVGKINKLLIFPYLISRINIPGLFYVNLE